MLTIAKDLFSTKEMFFKVCINIIKEYGIALFCRLGCDAGNFLYTALFTNCIINLIIGMIKSNI
jgi:hypothetical protein